MGRKQKGRFTEPLLPGKTIVEQDGVSIKHYYRSGDHSPAHIHVTGNGPDTRIGAKGHPLDGDLSLSGVQQVVVAQNLGQIRRAVNKIGRWLWYNEQSDEATEKGGSSENE